ncbi:MAG: hypothetical protein GWN53_17300 [Gammaproteobacteria bacterium]|uniref:Uncharacterized protein n=1 Tax=Candidatus Kutchimonas denitrificans TaxID=3056748 RepID=A0AAE5CAR0_9BACT|nr:hypothetical protein [Candidatus Kutchimonas denitrificans]NIV53599.1 hypothetical protein [Gammaproteobacteria bacterium]
MPKILVAQGLTALREAAYRTDAGLSTSDGIEFTEATLTPRDAFDGSRADVRHGTGGELVPTSRAGRTYDITLRGELKGRGAAYTTTANVLSEFPLYNIMLGAALSGSVAGGEISVTPVRPDNSGSFTLGFYTSDNLHKVEGCRGSFVVEANAGERAFWEFNGQGVIADSYPVSQTLPAITYATQSGSPPVYTADTPALGNWTPVIGGYRFEVANDIAPRQDGGASLGHAGFVLTNRTLNWSFPGESVNLDTFDPWSTSISGTTQQLQLDHGSATGNSFQYTLDDASVSAPEDTSDNGKLIWNLSGRGHIDSGNDEITITIK